MADLQNLFIWVLKGISVWGHKAKKFCICDDIAGFFVAKGLFSTITNANFDLKPITTPEADVAAMMAGR